MEPLRLLTLNTLMRNDVRPRLRVLASLLDGGGYDVVCLQEVMYRAHARLLGQHTGAYGRPVCCGAVLLAGGLVVLSRLPVTAVRSTRFPVTPPVRPELVMRKGAQVVTVRTADGPVVVVNTHLSANRDGDWSPGNRYARVQRAELHHLAAVVAGVDPALPLVLAGDLNVPRTAPMLAEFLAATGLVDSRAGDPGPTYRPTARFPAPPAFDHVLLRPGRTARTRLVFEDAVTLAGGRTAYLSDHFGIEARLS